MIALFQVCVHHQFHRVIVLFAECGLGQFFALLGILFWFGVLREVAAGNPVVVLLDIKLPKVDGLEVLRQMRAEATLRKVPVVMLTSSR